MAKNSTISNFCWKFAERISVQLISTVVSVILARILSPEHYGVISMVMVFITLANVFVSEGLGSTLIQKKDTTPLDFFSVLYFNIGFSILLYIILFFAAPYIAAFYGEGYEILTPVLRVLGLVVIINAVSTVLQAYVSKKMIFRKFFISTLFGTLISAVVGITMAYNGFGVWALVGQSLTASFVGTLFLGIALKKRPRLLFSFRNIRQLFPFGVRVLGTGLLITGYTELRALIIGKLYSSADLAYFDKGKQFPTLITNNVNSSLSAVLFPKMSNEQDDLTRVRGTMRSSLRLSSFLISPMMLGLAAVAPTFISVLLGEKWMPAVPLLQMFCVAEMFQPIHSVNMQAIKATGRGDTYLWVEVIKKGIELVILLLVMRISVTAIVLQVLACNVLFIFINAFPNKKLLGYGMKEQLADILPNILMAVVMFAAVYAVGLLPLHGAILLPLQILMGGCIYILLSIVTKNKEFDDIKNMIFSKIRQKGDEV